MTLTEKEADLIATLSQTDDVQERLVCLVDRCRRRPSLDPEFRTEPFRVQGCLTRLWLVGAFRDGKCHFQCDSDSVIVKAIAGVICEFYTGRTPEEILAHPGPEFLSKVGITQHLTPNRRNGLVRVWKTIRGFAESHRQEAAV